MAAATQGATPGPRAQLAAAVLMVRPAAFGANPETAASNPFQAAATATAAERAAALGEFDAAAGALAAAGVEVLVVEDTPVPAKPDAVFPNNWLSLHHDGTAVLYPLLSPLRRLERRDDILPMLQARGFAPRRVLDLTGWEAAGAFLEGTGSMVLDHAGGVAYACLSPRTDPRPLAQFAAELGYRPHTFHATGPAGEPVYHTNVVMCVGGRFAAACLDAVSDAVERAALREALGAQDREILALSRAQMNAFAGNMLALEDARGGPLVALSATAWAALGPAARRTLERHGRVVTAAVPTIERLGGGSLRCMLAEVFLPRRVHGPGAAG